MSRYVIPSRIGLLALLCIYTESAVPAAATIPVLSFLCSFNLPKTSSSSSDDIESGDFIASLQALQDATIGHPSVIPGRTIWDLLLDKLWKIDSLDKLHQFFDDLEFLLSAVIHKAEKVFHDPVSKRVRLRSTSPLGAFVRRAQIEFTRLQFHDSVILWRALKNWRGPSLLQWRKRNPSGRKSSLEADQEDFDGINDKILGILSRDDEADRSLKQNISTVDVSKLLEFQMDRMQRASDPVPFSPCTTNV